MPAAELRVGLQLLQQPQARLVLAAHRGEGGAGGTPARLVLLADAAAVPVMAVVVVVVVGRQRAAAPGPEDLEQEGLLHDGQLVGLLSGRAGQVLATVALPPAGVAQTADRHLLSLSLSLSLSRVFSSLPSVG